MGDQQKKIKLLNYVKSLVETEAALREKYNVGDNYRSISNRVKSLLRHLEENIDVSDGALTTLANDDDLSEGQQYVYVYLFNARGRILSRWVPMLSPRNFTEYSVNRPVYAEQKQVEAYIRSRPNDDEHAYLVIKINKADVISDQVQSSYHDATGQALLKLKERSLREECLVAFIYKGDRYRVLGGQLILESRNF